MTVATLPGATQHPTSPKRLHVEIFARHTAAVYGGRVKRLCDRADVPSMWNPTLRAWTISRRRIDDLLVFAEHIEKRFTTVAAVIDL